MGHEYKNDPDEVEQLLATPSLGDALESDRFKQFLDHVPVVQGGDKPGHWNAGVVLSGAA